MGAISKKIIKIIKNNIDKKCLVFNNVVIFDINYPTFFDIRKEYILFKNINVKKFVKYIKFNYKYIHKIILKKDYLIIYKKIINANNCNMRKDNIIDMFSLKEAIQKTDFQFYEYNNKYFSAIVCKKNLFINGTSSKNNFDCEKIAFYEYLERICSFGSYQKKLKFIKNKYDIFYNIYSWVDDNFVYKKYKVNEVILCNSVYGVNKILVPKEYIFYNYNSSDTDVIRGNSNGISIGNSLKEAIVYGILEYIERDTFIRFWYFNEFELILINNINVNTDEEYELKNAGYSVYYIQIKRDIDFYIIWTLIVSETECNNIYCVSGLAIDTDIIKSLKKSFEEAFLLWKNMTKEQNLLDKIEYVVRNKFVYSNYKYGIQEYIKYYYASKCCRKEIEKILENIQNRIDLLSILNKKINYMKSYESVYVYLKKQNLSFYFYDMSMPIMKKFGLYCVKVFSDKYYDLYFYPTQNKIGRSNIMPLS